MNGSSPKVLLNDVVVMRLFLIAMLIIYHSFAPFCGNWDALFDHTYNSFYYWMGKTSYSFFLEAFVFISGLLTGYQAVEKPLKDQNYTYIKNKFIRLIVPSIVFSVIYFILFYEWNGTFSFVYSVIKGCGHMWFLPMLFWCFVGIWVISKFNINQYYILIFSIVVSLLSNDIIPFRIGTAMYYFLFFYIGYSIYKLNLRRYLVPKFSYISTCGVLYIVTFLYYTGYQPHTWGGVIFTHFLKAILSLAGIIACYLMTMRYEIKNRKLPTIFVTLSKYSFGIYIMQQFILRYLYYRTSLSESVDYILVPWIGLLCALVLNIISTHYLLKTKIGHALLC